MNGCENHLQLLVGFLTQFHLLVITLKALKNMAPRLIRDQLTKQDSACLIQILKVGLLEALPPPEVGEVWVRRQVFSIKAATESLFSTKSPCVLESSENNFYVMIFESQGNYGQSFDCMLSLIVFLYVLIKLIFSLSCKCPKTA